MKSIIFSTPMVKAILDGRKKCTRRVVKPQPPQFVDYFEKRGDGFKAYMVPGEPCDYPLVKPKYQPGDILWVRETWRVGAWNENTGCIAVDYKADGFARREWIEIKDPELFEQYWIQSTDDAVKAGLETDSDGQYHWEPGKGPTRWRPSIFMPREAARIFLRVTNVRVERVQEITAEDVIREGIKYSDSGPYHWHVLDTKLNAWINFHFHDEAFKHLWDSLNAKRGCGWDTNPWVWVYEFEKINKE